MIRRTLGTVIASASLCAAMVVVAPAVLSSAPAAAAALRCTASTTKTAHVGYSTETVAHSDCRRGEDHWLGPLPRYDENGDDDGQERGRHLDDISESFNALALSRRHRPVGQTRDRLEQPAPRPSSSGS